MVSPDTNPFNETTPRVMILDRTLKPSQELFNNEL